MANLLTAHEASLEERFAHGEEVVLRARPIDVGPSARFYGYILPRFVPLVLALSGMLGSAAALRLLSAPNSAFTPILLAGLACGLVVGTSISHSAVGRYRENLLRGPQPSAVLSASAIELDLPALGQQRFDWSQITGLTFVRPAKGRGAWPNEQRCELIGTDGRLLAVVPWSLVLAEDEYQLGEYMAAAAPDRFALDPRKAFLPDYPRQILMGVRLTQNG